MSQEEITRSSLTAEFSALQAIACCPRDRTALSLVTISELMARLPPDEVTRVPKTTVGAFVSESALTAYPIADGIVDFLEQDSLRLSGTIGHASGERDSASESITLGVERWYDDFGWKRDEAGVYHDTAMFSQSALTAHGFYELASHLSLLDRLGGGEFVLDAASGAIAHPEYLAYSWFYRYRVCVDISRTALEEARRKVAERGFYCLADICRLPFRESVFDGAVSAYTIQHIPEAQQARAVTELYRALKPGGHLCIISDAVPHWMHDALVTALRVLRKILRLVRVVPAGAGFHRQGAKAFKPPHDLYAHMRDVGWWRRLARDLTGSDRVEGLRIFRKPEFDLLFGGSMRAARLVSALESLLRRRGAKLSAFLLIDLEKKPCDGVGS